MTTTPRPKKAKPAAAAPLPSEVDIEAITAKVTEVTNNIMDKVIRERDKQFAAYTAMGDTISDAKAQVRRLAIDVANMDAQARKACKLAEDMPKKLQLSLEEIQGKLVSFLDTGAGEALSMVGHMVRIKGGKRDMVASGFDDAGYMLCVYEDGDNVVTKAVPPLALELVQPA